MKRGEIWWADLPRPQGCEPGYRRPVLVVQDDEFNRSLISTVIVVVITTNLRLGQAPGNTVLPRKASGLPQPSVANVSQLITIDKSLLIEKVGRLDPQLFTEVENGLRLVLSLL